MNKYLKIFLFLLLIFLLFLVRAFAQKVFYDPLINYFKNDYLYTTIPTINLGRFLLHLCFRYTLNSIISLAIIWVVFQQTAYIKFASFFLLIAFVILLITFIILLKNNFENGYLLPFYIRRFLIHPLFLLLLLPAFYYQKLSAK